MLEELLQTGVYRILNLLDGKFYIGSAVRTFEKRWNGHRNELRTGKHVNLHLQRAWNRDGEESFKFEVMETCEGEELCLAREQFYLDTLTPWNDNIGYNLSRVATKAPMTGRKHTPESLAKMSAKHKGRECPMKGKKHSPESLKKMSESQKKRPSNRKGSKHSEESKKLMSQVHMGKTLSDETKKKVSLHHWKHSDNAEEIRKKCSEAHKGLVKSEEHCQHLSESNKATWEAKTPEQKQEFSESVKAAHWSKGPNAAEVKRKIKEGKDKKRAERSAQPHVLPPMIQLPPLSFFRRIIGASKAT